LKILKKLKAFLAESVRVGGLQKQRTPFFQRVSSFLSSFLPFKMDSDESSPYYFSFSAATNFILTFKIVPSQETCELIKVNDDALSHKLAPCEVGNWVSATYGTILYWKWTGDGPEDSRPHFTVQIFKRALKETGAPCFEIKIAGAGEGEYAEAETVFEEFNGGDGENDAEELCVWEPAEDFLELAADVLASLPPAK
jgi:hypothetical protein